MKNEFLITDVEFFDEFEGDNKSAYMTCTIKTGKGEMKILEWINENDGTIEQIDSHIVTNQEEELANLFDFSNFSSFLSVLDCFDFNFFDILQEYLNKNIHYQAWYKEEYE